MGFLDLRKIDQVLGRCRAGGRTTITPAMVAQILDWPFEKAARSLEEYAQQTRAYLATSLTAFCYQCNNSIDVTRELPLDPKGVAVKTCFSCGRKNWISPEDVFVYYTILPQFDEEHEQGGDVDDPPCRRERERHREGVSLARLPADVRDSLLARMPILVYPGGYVTVNQSGDRYTFGDVIGPVTIHSRLDDVVQTVSGSASLAVAEKEGLTALLEELKAELAKLSQSHPAEAELIADEVESLGKEVSREAPRATRLGRLIDGLNEAVERVQAFAPSVVLLARRIVGLVRSLVKA